MSASSGGGSESTPHPLAEQAMSAAIDFQRAGAGLLAWTSPDWLRAVSDFRAEMADFMSERIRQDLATQVEVLQCRDLVELRALQCRYMKTAFEQYCDEMSKLVRMNRAMLDGWSGRSSGD